MVDKGHCGAPNARGPDDAVKAVRDRLSYDRGRIERVDGKEGLLERALAKTDDRAIRIRRDAVLEAYVAVTPERNRRRHQAPVTEAARLLGHSSPAVTLKVYAQWFDGALFAKRTAPDSSKVAAAGGGSAPADTLSTR